MLAELRGLFLVLIFFFNDTATTEIYTLSLHDALPIYDRVGARRNRYAARRGAGPGGTGPEGRVPPPAGDRKSTRLNSSHSQISYAVFCLKKKTNIDTEMQRYGLWCLMILQRNRGHPLS